MRILLCSCFIAGALVVASPAHATATTSTKCFQVGLRTNSRDVASSSLASSDAGFRWLRTAFSYGLRLEGKQYNSNGRWYFEPERFAVGGQTLATSGANPAGQALGSVTAFRLVSTVKTRRITESEWTSNGTSRSSGVLPWTAPLTGPATPASGLYEIVVHSAVAAGGDGPVYWTSTASWRMPPSYRGALDASSPSFPGLMPLPCASVAWG